MSLAAIYESLIVSALSELRKDVKGLGKLHRCGSVAAVRCGPCSQGGPLWILTPLDTGRMVEVLFLVGEEGELEPMTAYFEDSDKPGLPQLAPGW